MAALSFIVVWSWIVILLASSGRNRNVIHGQYALFGICMIVFAAYSTDAQREECLEKDFSECLKSFDTIISHQNLGFAANEEELNSACRHLKSGVNCIDRFVKRCTRDKSQQDTLSLSVKGAFDILELLCEDTYHRNQYLQHANCYRRIASQIEDCMLPMRTMGLRQQAKDGSNKAKIDSMVCCAYYNSTQCIENVASKECNERAATFLKNYTDRAAYPITIQCRNFDSKLCSKSPTTFSKTISVAMVVIFFVSHYVVS